jgi:hypothetical protein
VIESLKTSTGKVDIDIGIGKAYRGKLDDRAVGLPTAINVSHCGRRNEKGNRAFR